MRKREFPSAIPMSYARPLLEQLRRLDGDLDALWHEAHIETPLQAVLGQEVDALPAPEFTRLYRHSVGMLERRFCEREGRPPRQARGECGRPRLYFESGCAQAGIVGGGSRRLPSMLYTGRSWASGKCRL